MQKATNIHWHSGEITRQDRERVNGHKGVTLWLTGLSASGKSTVARKLEEKLFEMGCQVVVLDGDNVRHGLNKNLGFSREDREENIRRVAELAKLLTSNGIINITAFISPYRADRARAREIQAEGDFLEVFVDCPLEACEARDPKGLYAKARRGEIKVFTGIDDPYEEPENPELVLDTRADDVDGSANALVEFLAAKVIIKNG
ncbi:MAG TPA: adenylyl-sulfate kinase [Nitrospirota bacterium]|jgi:adenylylsulfate kinase